MAIYIKRKPKPLFPHFTSRKISFDTEGTGLIPYGSPEYWGYHPASPFAFAFCDGDGNTAYFRWRVDPKTRRVEPEKSGLAILHRLMHEDWWTIIGHNIAYDFRMTATLGEIIQHRNVEDTMVKMHVATGGDELSYALKPLSKKYLDYPDDDEKTLELEVQDKRRLAKTKGWMIAIGKKELERGDRGVFAGNKPVKADYWLVPSPRMRQSPNTQNIDPDGAGVDKVQRYALGDVIRAQLMNQLCDTMLAEDERLQITYRREMGLFWALRRMEEAATRVYPDHTHYLISWYQDYMKNMKKMGDTDPSPSFPKGVNFMSPKQLMKIFHEERGYPIAYKDRKKLDKKTGEKISYTSATLGKDQFAILGGTDEDTGEYKDTLAKAALEWRSAKQTIKSFLNIYSTFWYPVDKKKNIWVLHPNINQCGAVTGRLTESDPNLQQVAAEDTGLRKSEIPQKPRECFGPRPGHLWYLPDFSQVEIWAFAFLFKETEMQKLLLSGHDFHQGVADKTFTSMADYEERRKYYRKLAKLIMFGKLYGGGVGTPEKPGRMCGLLQQPYDQAKLFIDSFEEEFAAVKRSTDEITRKIKKSGEWWNAYGRRYILGKNIAYKGVNYHVQGTCADLLKVAIVRLDWMLQRRWPGVRLINTLHDELILEVPYRLHSQRLMKEIMWVMQMDSEFIGVSVPLPVGMKITYPVGPMELDSTPKKPPKPTNPSDIPQWEKDMQRWKKSVQFWPEWKPTWTDKRQVWAKTKTIGEGLSWMRPAGDGYVFGGVPRDDRPYDDLRRNMQACPY